MIFLEITLEGIFVRVWVSLLYIRLCQTMYRAMSGSTVCGVRVWVSLLYIRLCQTMYRAMSGSTVCGVRYLADQDACASSLEMVNYFQEDEKACPWSCSQHGFSAGSCQLSIDTRSTDRWWKRHTVSLYHTTPSDGLQQSVGMYPRVNSRKKTLIHSFCKDSCW